MQLLGTLLSLTAETSFKAGIKQKQKKANRNNAYLSQAPCRARILVVFVLCLNLLKRETSFEGGVQRKRMKCAMDVNYLSKVLRALE